MKFCGKIITYVEIDVPDDDWVAPSEAADGVADLIDELIQHEWLPDGVTCISSQVDRCGPDDDDGADDDEDDDGPIPEPAPAPPAPVLAAHTEPTDA